VNFEDIGTGSKLADVVINALYDEHETHNRGYYGAEYYFLPKLFLLYSPIQIHESVNNIFICFGGADPMKYTQKLLDIVSKEQYSKFKFTVVLGKAIPNYAELLERQAENITVLYDVKNMPELMSSTDVAITSQGRTCYELASLGIPTLSIAQNDRELRHEFVCADNGFVKMGIQNDMDQIEKGISEFLALSQADRKNIQQKMLKTDLKRGRDRVKSIIESV